ncbi:cadherin-like domain-containing protein, partial [Pyxidicoccus sp. 3LG]
MHLEHTSGFFPNIRVSILLVSWVLAACGGGEEKPPPRNPPTNRAPVAVNDVATTLEDTAVVIPATTLVSNDTDADGDSLTVTVVGTATHGTVRLAGGNVTFTPEANYFGTATFEYTVSDGTSTSTSTVTVTVNSVNDAPVAVFDSAFADEDVVLVIPVATLLSNDKDVVEGDSLTVSQVANAHNGMVELDGDDVRFTPTLGFAGAARFEYQVSDSGGATATASVALIVRASGTKRVDAGSSHTCAVFPDGGVKCWGANTAGQLGLEETGARGDDPNEMGSFLSFVRLGTGQKVTTLTVGGSFTCALLESGAVKCWGDNASGELGLGDRQNRGDGAGEMGDALPPVDLGMGRTAKALVAGVSHTCAILDDGTVKCWGDNSSGKLGLGDGRWAPLAGDECRSVGAGIPA